ncbi:type II toxin-antitoxin system PemK/MazF family toxin [Thiococcus pfennigii]|uniref:type II toxin-antitoxin system PemK/MazF family toxin n=1 Tax=Thiococcus pfennigii TaxID=1057 RepID=UPI001903EA58|nr:type II toxin-antitoxin system PemK/MazF family toxin [Thiococcus pfennigii]MBK1733387.1 growth inhibitor PemK [Thiococcus pfennigii]
MPTFTQGDVVKVPFSYTSRPTRQSRPALVISAGDITDGNASDFRLLWVLMITSVQNRGWPGDVVLDDLSGTGLPAPSVIRTAKIATIEAGDATRLGCIGDGVRAEVLGRLRGHLGIDPAR